MALRVNPFHYSSPPEVIRGFLQLAVHVLIAVFFLRAFSMRTYTIPSRSMENSLLVGDHVLVDVISHRRFTSSPDMLVFPRKKLKRGMMIAFHPPGRPESVFVKRIIGLPGDRVGIHDQRVYINGVLLNEPYVKEDRDNASSRLHIRIPEERIPPHHFFCLGDNRKQSNDSRYWGTLPRKNILGIPWRILWSLKSLPSDYSAACFMDNVHRLAAYVRNVLFRTRWGRTLHSVQESFSRSMYLNMKTRITINEK